MKVYDKLMFNYFINKNKKHRFWIYALIIAGIVSFTISCKKEKEEETIIDGDGNVYSSVTIGTQVWMVENLKTTKYSNSDPIANITDDTQWDNLLTDAYCWYNNDAATYKISYGALYNWYAVSNSKNICPTGWHVPSDAEWTDLINYLGGTDIAGGKLKETGTGHWQNPNTGATNEMGFTALPGGCRGYGGSFSGISGYGSWWSATEDGASGAYKYTIFNNFSNINRGSDAMQLGLSVRCVKD